MGAFVYKAMDPQLGLPVEGEIEAEDKRGVSEHLRGKGLIVLDIEEQKMTDIGDMFARFKKVKPDALVIFTRQFSTMVDSGMSILRCLYVLEDQTEDSLLTETIADIRDDLEAGIGLADSLEKHPEVFNDLYISMVRAGEAGGILEETLQRVATQLEKDYALRRQVKAAMMYPMFIGGFAFVVLVALLTFLVPVFAGVFKDLGSDLPPITKATVALSNGMKTYWYIALILPIGGRYAFRYWKNTDSGLASWHKFVLRLPFKIGDIVQKVALARWSRSFASLTAAGVPVMQAIEVSGRTSGNNEVKLAMGEVITSIEGGGTISAPIKALNVFPPMVGHMVAAGEETGALEEMLNKIAEFYESEVEAAVKALTSILEPVMIVVVGGMVGFIVIAMYMPMFKIFNEIE